MKTRNSIAFLNPHFPTFNRRAWLVLLLSALAVSFAGWRGSATGKGINSVPAYQASTNVSPGEFGQYTLVYDIDPQNELNMGSSPYPYTTDNSASIASGSFDRVAYYIELNDGSGLKWLWVSMAAFTTDPKKIGVPTTASGAVFQQTVSSMNVESNLAGIVTGTGITTGNIEFWPTNYDRPNSASVPGASGTVFDFGDQRLTANGYGCMQVHNHGARQTLFAYNRWNRAGTDELGIGNNATGTGDPDWTFSESAGNYTLKKIQVYVKTPNAPPTITAATNLPRQQGSPIANFNIATVNDNETAPGNLTVTVTSSNPSNGVTLSGISNSGGTISANIVASCAASNAAFTLQVSDGAATNTATLNVVVLPNSEPLLNYGSSRNITVGGSITVNPVIGPEDNGTFTIGTPSISPAGFAGTISAAQNGVLSITNSGGQAGNYTVTVPITDNCNVIASSTFTLRVNCPTITLSPATLPGGTAGTAYSQTVSASPSGGNDSFAVTGGSLPAGLNLASNGSLSGIPSQQGNFSFEITATSFGTCTGKQTYNLTIACPAITLSPASLPNATINAAYSQTLGASPAGGNYGFVVTSGLLPAGLTLNANGTFGGAATQSGTFSFRVTATGFGGCSEFRDYVLVVNCLTITFDQASLPGGSVGSIYNQAVSASPAGSYNYNVTSGALPPGLSLNAATGQITGTPTTIGSFNFTISAAAGACSGSRNYSVTISCPSLSFTTASPLQAGSAGVAYSQPLNVAPAGSYTFSLVGGSLPSGLLLNSATGVISGTPASVAAATFTVKAQSANGCNATQSYLLTIACPGGTLSPASLPSGTVGTAYSQNFAASPAGGNYSYSASGTLPTGLNLNSSIGALSGVPSANGSFTFTVTATGFGGCTSSASYTVVISGGGDGCGTITLPASVPNGSVGQLYNKAVAASPAGLYNYTATGNLPSGVTLFNANGLIFGFPAAAGSYTFTITAAQGSCSASKSYTMVIGAGFASSLTVFSDFDGDGKSDLSVFREGNWLIANSGDGQVQSTMWGSSTASYYDVTVPGDYDGDGKTDMAVFRRGGDSAGYWFIKQSSDGQVKSHFWGLPTDIPAPGDYDGDGKTDIAVWRGAAGVWYILRSSDGRMEGIAWGAASAGDIPVPGDYDGDRKTDVAVFRRGILPEQGAGWHIRRSSDGGTTSRKWGVGTDVPVPGDYDGDNRTDIAVWRVTEGNWYIVESGTAVIRTISGGDVMQGDLPVAADYDGDGKVDAAIWRAASGTWIVKRSSDHREVFKIHGQSGDLPIMAKRNN